MLTGGDLKLHSKRVKRKLHSKRVKRKLHSKRVKKSTLETSKLSRYYSSFASAVVSCSAFFTHTVFTVETVGTGSDSTLDTIKLTMLTGGDLKLHSKRAKRKLHTERVELKPH